jgi:pimeloyl-ACP methyl ester carboxylesterase
LTGGIPKKHMINPLFTRITTLSFAIALGGCASTGSKKSEPVMHLANASTSLKKGRSPRIPIESRVGSYLYAADEAVKVLPARPGDPQAIATYNAATAELTELLYKGEGGRLWNQSLSFSAEGERYGLKFQGIQDGGSWAPGYFTDLEPASRVRRRHLRKTFVRPGVGAPFVGIHETKGLGFGSKAPFEPASGTMAPVTATLSFKGNVATLALQNPDKRNEVSIGGKSLPLAADYTAPLARYPQRNELLQGFLSMIRVEKYLSNAGLYMIEPYDPNRIPVIFVHGLMSTPLMWLNAMNELHADENLRGRYQFWVFNYPTGNPMSYSSLRFREELARVQSLHPMTKGYVLVGHSMGGLVSRMQAVDTGRALWKANLKHKADELDRKLPANNLVKQALIVESNPRVSRIVFICVPHRGSEMAMGSIGALAMRIISLPKSLVGTLTNSLGDVLSVVSGSPQVPNSITSLSPKNPTLKELDRLPIRAPYHSIIGDRGKGDSPNSSDGVVPYWSSHLDGAKSELIVPGPHGSHELPQTLAELKRILLLNKAR